MVMQLAVNELTVAQLEHVAREKNTTPQRLAEQAIREFLRSEARRTMQREMNTFFQLHADSKNAASDTSCRHATRRRRL